MREVCAYCGKVAQGEYSIHRDGFGIGPEVPLCNACGGGTTPSLPAIWSRIARPSLEQGAFDTTPRLVKAAQLRAQRRIDRTAVVQPTTRQVELAE